MNDVSEPMILRLSKVIWNKNTQSNQLDESSSDSKKQKLTIIPPEYSENHESFQNDLVCEEPESYFESITTSLSSTTYLTTSPLDDSLQTTAILPYIRAVSDSLPKQLRNSMIPSGPTEDMSFISNLTYKEAINHLVALRIEQIQRLIRPIITKLIQHPRNVNLFNSPVDPVALNIPDYLFKISRPMDLGTVKSRLQRGNYLSLSESIADIALVFQNALSFNPESTFTHQAAKALLLEFESEKSALEDKCRKVAEKKLLHSCSLCMGSSCSLCGEKCLTFEPPVLVCHGACNQRIKRNTVYYISTCGTYVWCQKCHVSLPPIIDDLGPLPSSNALSAIPPSTSSDSLSLSSSTTSASSSPTSTSSSSSSSSSSIRFSYTSTGRARPTLEKASLLKRRLDEEVAEPWVHCDSCGSWVHQICALYNEFQETITAASTTPSTNIKFECVMCRVKHASPDPRLARIAPGDDMNSYHASSSSSSYSVLSPQRSRSHSTSSSSSKSYSPYTPAASDRRTRGRSSSSSSFSSHISTSSSDSRDFESYPLPSPSPSHPPTRGRPSRQSRQNLFDTFASSSSSSSSSLNSGSEAHYLDSPDCFDNASSSHSTSSTQAFTSANSTGTIIKKKRGRKPRNQVSLDLALPPTAESLTPFAHSCEEEDVDTVGVVCQDDEHSSLKQVDSTLCVKLEGDDEGGVEETKGEPQNTSQMIEQKKHVEFSLVLSHSSDPQLYIPTTTTTTSSSTCDEILLSTSSNASVASTQTDSEGEGDMELIVEEDDQTLQPLYPRINPPLHLTTALPTALAPDLLPVLDAEDEVKGTRDSDVTSLGDESGSEECEEMKIESMSCSAPSVDLEEDAGFLPPLPFDRTSSLSSDSSDCVKSTTKKKIPPQFLDQKHQQQQQHSQQQQLTPRRRFSAKQLPHTLIGDILETMVKDRLTECGFAHCVDSITVRMTSNALQSMDVPEEIIENFRNPQGMKLPKTMSYRQKCVLLFQEIDGVDVCLFCLYAQEFDASCPAPNNSVVYIAYLDSVDYFRPLEARTLVYHEILVGYLKTCQERGFRQGHIWSCPPQRGDNFIFWCHPPHQRTPSRDRLSHWYSSMLNRCLSLGILSKIRTLYEVYLSEYSKREKDESQHRLAARQSYVSQALALSTAKEMSSSSYGRTGKSGNYSSLRSESFCFGPNQSFPTSPDIGTSESPESPSYSSLTNSSSFSSALSLSEIKSEPNVPIALPIFEGDFWVTEFIRMHRSILSRNHSIKGNDVSVNQRRTREVLKALMSKPQASPFNFPVDPVALQIPHYPMIITRPMDLGTIRDKLRANQYDTLWQLFEDVQLTFQNAMTFNPSGHPIYLMAEKLLDIFTNMVSELVKELFGEDNCYEYLYPSSASRYYPPASPLSRQSSFNSTNSLEDAHLPGSPFSTPWFQRLASLCPLKSDPSNLLPPLSPSSIHLSSPYYSSSSSSSSSSHMSISTSSGPYFFGSNPTNQFSSSSPRSSTRQRTPSSTSQFLNQFDTTSRSRSPSPSTIHATSSSSTSSSPSPRSSASASGSASPKTPLSRSTSERAMIDPSGSGLEGSTGGDVPPLSPSASLPSSVSSPSPLSPGSPRSSNNSVSSTKSTKPRSRKKSNDPSNPGSPRSSTPGSQSCSALMLQLPASASTLYATAFSSSTPLPFPLRKRHNQYTKRKELLMLAQFHADAEKEKEKDRINRGESSGSETTSPSASPIPSNTSQGDLTMGSIGSMGPGMMGMGGVGVGGGGVGEERTPHREGSSPSLSPSLSPSPSSTSVLMNNPYPFPSLPGQSYPTPPPPQSFPLPYPQHETHSFLSSSMSSPSSMTSPSSMSPFNPNTFYLSSPSHPLTSLQQQSSHPVPHPLSHPPQSFTSQPYPLPPPSSPNSSLPAPPSLRSIIRPVSISSHSQLSKRKAQPRILPSNPSLPPSSSSSLPYPLPNSLPPPPPSYMYHPHPLPNSLPHTLPHPLSYPHPHPHSVSNNHFPQHPPLPLPPSSSPQSFPTPLSPLGGLPSHPYSLPPSSISPSLPPSLPPSQSSIPPPSYSPSTSLSTSETPTSSSLSSSPTSSPSPPLTLPLPPSFPTHCSSSSSFSSVSSVSSVSCSEPENENENENENEMEEDEEEDDDNDDEEREERKEEGDIEKEKDESPLNPSSSSTPIQTQEPYPQSELIPEPELIPSSSSTTTSYPSSSDSFSSYPSSSQIEEQSGIERSFLPSPLPSPSPPSIFNEECISRNNDFPLPSSPNNTEEDMRERETDRVTGSPSLKRERKEESESTSLSSASSSSSDFFAHSSPRKILKFEQKNQNEDNEEEDEIQNNNNHNNEDNNNNNNENNNNNDHLDQEMNISHSSSSLSSSLCSSSLSSSESTASHSFTLPLLPLASSTTSTPSQSTLTTSIPTSSSPVSSLVSSHLSPLPIVQKRHQWTQCSSRPKQPSTSSPSSSSSSPISPLPLHSSSHSSSNLLLPVLKPNDNDVKKEEEQSIELIEIKSEPSPSPPSSPPLIKKSLSPTGKTPASFTLPPSELLVPFDRPVLSYRSLLEIMNDLSKNALRLKDDLFVIEFAPPSSFSSSSSSESSSSSSSSHQSLSLLQVNPNPNPNNNNSSLTDEIEVSSPLTPPTPPSPPIEMIEQNPKENETESDEMTTTTTPTTTTTTPSTSRLNDQLSSDPGPESSTSSSSSSIVNSSENNHTDTEESLPNLSSTSLDSLSTSLSSPLSSSSSSPSPRFIPRGRGAGRSRGRKPGSGRGGMSLNPALSLIPPSPHSASTLSSSLSSSSLSLSSSSASPSSNSPLSVIPSSSSSLSSTPLNPLTLFSSLARSLLSSLKPDTSDPDPLSPSALLESRNSFLELCQYRQYQFDSLRRAKYSSLMVLFHLLNPYSPVLKIRCSQCRSAISDLRWHCDQCARFDMCVSCYEKSQSGMKTNPSPSLSLPPSSSSCCSTLSILPHPHELTPFRVTFH